MTIGLTIKNFIIVSGSVLAITLVGCSSPQSLCESEDAKQSVIKTVREEALSKVENYAKHLPGETNVANAKALVNSVPITVKEIKADDKSSMIQCHAKLNFGFSKDQSNALTSVYMDLGYLNMPESMQMQNHLAQMGFDMDSEGNQFLPIDYTFLKSTKSSAVEKQNEISDAFAGMSSLIAFQPTLRLMTDEVKKQHFASMK